MRMWATGLYHRLMDQHKLSAIFLGLLVVLWAMYAWGLLAHSPLGGAAPGARQGTQPPVRGLTVAHTVVVGTPSMTVYIVGQVKRPGLYHLPLDARVADAIAKAGGATADADLAAIDLAAIVEDGMEVVVPGMASVASSSTGSASAQGASVAAVGIYGGNSRASSEGRHHHKKKLAPGERINLNTASAGLLEELPGIGAKKAEAILQYRMHHGLFVSLSELRRVSGIGPALLARLSAYLTL